MFQHQKNHVLIMGPIFIYLRVDITLKYYIQVKLPQHFDGVQKIGSSESAVVVVARKQVLATQECVQYVCIKASHDRDTPCHFSRHDRTDDA